MWGSGNLTGNLEDGVLVWRNRRGEVAYRWEKLPEKIKGKPTPKKTEAAKARQTFSRCWMNYNSSLKTD